MGSGIDLAEIGFGLDDAADEQLTLVAAHQQLSEQFARDDGGVAVEEAGRDRLLLAAGYAGWLHRQIIDHTSFQIVDFRF